MVKKYFFNVLIAIDQLANTLLGGDPDETLSSRMGKRVKHCRVCFYVCRVLHFFDPQHCQKSIESDEGSDAIG
jgi:hypothetical protein